ncbi:DsbA family protein, partial [Streptosporangium canum]|uniref:DsbA family oxidoreductase n=1 Tax=Streptosporangium canum TaxID=324952 RepID=UPI003414C117
VAGFPGVASRAGGGGLFYADAVRADEDEARRRGVSGVPSFVITGRRIITGAQSPDVLLEELRLAWRRVTG